MAVTDAEYLTRFIDDVDAVTGGRAGAISGDRWLVKNYDPGKLRLLLPYLSFEEPRVRAELVSVLGDVRERSVRDRVEEMYRREGDLVSMACLGYLTTLRDDDEAIPRLLDAMDHTRGNEFSSAARRMASIARAEDVPHLRRIYGQVGGTMRDETREVLERVIARNPELVPKRDLILSLPVYPDEAAYERFLDASIEYLDVRYRERVAPRPSVPEAAYNDVVRALRKMRTRLYNEADNLSVYGVDKEDRTEELSSLVAWASEDLSRKEVVRRSREGPYRVCPRCGGLLTFYKGTWICPDCGGLRSPVPVIRDTSRVRMTRSRFWKNLKSHFRIIICVRRIRHV